MARVTWMDAAQQDVQEIHEYIRRDSRSAADAMVRRLRASGRQLSRFSESGHVVPDYDDPQLRELIIGSYRLVYRFQSDGQ